MFSMRSRSGVGWLTLTVLAVGLAAGCSLLPGSSPTPVAGGGALADTSWLLGEVEGTPVVSGTNADLIFAEELAGGFSGCNRFTTSYQTDGSSTLTFGPIAGTRMACDQAANDFETTYLAALAKVAKYAMTADALTLSDSGGTVVLTYAAAPPASVVGAWNVISVNNGNQGVESVPAGVSGSLGFEPDGLLQGFGGCNDFSGEYMIDGDSITIGPLMSTFKICGGAADTFEQQLFAALDNATKWDILSGSLELRDDSGALQVSATSALGH